MKICFIVGAFPKMKCGIGDYCSKLAQELANNKNDIYVITSTEADTNIEGVKIFNIVEKWDNSDTKKIVSTLKTIKPDVVNIQYPSNEYNKTYYILNILPLIIKLKLKCKLSETIHEHPLKLSQKGKIKYYFNFKIIDKVIVVEEIFEKLIKNSFKNIDVQYIPISSSIPKVVINEEEKKEIRNKLGLNSNNIISYFGFINEKKGIENLLKCISKLDDVQLLIIGELNSNNDYHNKILNLIDTLNLKDKIKTTGFIENEKLVAKYINATDLCVLPFVDGVQKRNSSFLATYNQHIPIITTSTNSMKDEKGIYYVRCNNEDELLEKINYVLEHKPKEILREELNWENVASKYIYTLE